MPGFDLSALPAGVSLLLLTALAAVAGVINIMAGGGSLLVLPVLIALGLPPGIANGTIRVGVFVQNLSATVTFHRRGVKAWGLVARLAPVMIVGAAGGTWLATKLSNEMMRPIIGAVLALWAVALVIRPGRFLSAPTEPRPPGPAAYAGAAAIGIYGGFLQAGVGFPILALLVTGLGYTPVHANSAKVLLVLAYTCISLPIFALNGQVAWREGIALAVGAMLGGWVGTRWQIHAGAGVVRWFVVGAVGVSAAVMIATSIE